MAEQAIPTRRLLIGGHQFLIGYQQQQEWSWLIATAFFLGKVGGGLFMISFFSDFKLGALVGIAVVGIGKTTAHLLYLGKPSRFLRAVVRWKTSWISRGIIGMAVLCLLGAVYVAPYIHISFVPNGVAHAFGIAALPFAFLIMFYDGFVLKASKGIAFWDSYLMPVLMLFYATLGGITATLALEVFASEVTTRRLEWVEIALLVVNLLLIGFYVVSARVRGAASELAARLLQQERMGRLFLVAIAVGLGCTLVLAAVSVSTHSGATLAVAALTDLVGHFFVFFAILRVGIHAPIRPLPVRSIRPEPVA
jgi:formate-dependent nitrite reductase membrane component NrfD